MARKKSWTRILLGVFFASGVVVASEMKKDYPVKPVPFTAVQITDGFWTPRLETNRKVTIPYDFKKCERTGRVENFDVASGKKEGLFQGKFGFNDTDVYKTIEGASYCLQLYSDAELEKYLDLLIAKIEAAQAEDGYLYTAGMIKKKAEAQVWCLSEPRWSDLKSGHELYNCGHMYEAAAAHYQATGKHSFLNVAIKNADLLCQEFGPGKNRGVPGHQEVEIGLVKLYRATGDEKYLTLAKFFLDERGNAEGHKLYGPYNQDHKPVTEQDEAVGHAVRAGYMYSAMADVAAFTGDSKYITAIDRIWENVVSKKLYLTGGIGARHEGESFGDNYELPNKTAYNETCAAIANVMWNHRLFLLHGDAKYIDVLERTVYNGFLSGVSLEGDKFFYPNPLASDGRYKFNKNESATRRAWFDCSCCPTNVVRFISSLGGYVYAHRDDVLYVNLFMGSNVTFRMKTNQVRLKQETRYPWDSHVKITVEPEKSEEFSVYVRIPGWTQGQPVPSNLYRYLNKSNKQVKLNVNGKSAALDIDKGFVRIRRKWKKGDVIELIFPMPIHRVLCNENVESNAGRVALERGPLVYCTEGVDNNGRVSNIFLLDNVQLEAEYRKDLLGGVIVIRGRAAVLHRSENGKSAEARRQDFMAVPYYCWSHRGEGEMSVWLARQVSLNPNIE